MDSPSSISSIDDPKLSFKDILNKAATIGLIKVPLFLYTSHKFPRRTLLNYIDIYIKANIDDKVSIFNRVFKKMRNCYIDSKSIPLCKHGRKSGLISEKHNLDYLKNYTEEHARQLREWIFDHCCGYISPREEFEQSYANY